MKLWHLLLKAPASEDRRREVRHEAESRWTDEAFVEYLLLLGSRASHDAEYSKRYIICMCMCICDWIKMTKRYVVRYTYWIVI